MKLNFTTLLLFVSMLASAQQSTLIGLAKRTSNGKEVRLSEINPATGEVSIFPGPPVTNHLTLNGATLNVDGNQYCYSSPGVTGTQLNVVDALTGDLIIATNVTLPANAYFDAIRYNCNDGFFYGIYRTSTSLKSAKIDAMTGAVAIVSQLSIGSTLSFDYTIDKTNNLYIIKMDNEVKSIDLSTGNIVSSSTMNLPTGNYFEGIAYSCTNSTIYGTVRNSSGIRFASLDQTNGNVTILNSNSFAGSVMMGAGTFLDDAEGKYYYNTGSAIVTIDITSGDVLYNEPLSYSAPGTHSLYYIQKNTSCTCPGALAVAEPTSENSFSVYPNPVKDVITISSSSKTLETISIVDAYGREIMLKEAADFSNAVQLDVSQLASGIYFVRVANKYSSRFSVIR